MIDRNEGLSIMKQRNYITAENIACSILRNNGYIAHGNPRKLGRAVVVYKKINAYSSKYLGEYKNFQEAKEQLIEESAKPNT